MHLKPLHTATCRTEIISFYLPDMAMLFASMKSQFKVGYTIKMGMSFVIHAKFANMRLFQFIEALAVAAVIVMVGQLVDTRTDAPAEEKIEVFEKPSTPQA